MSVQSQLNQRAMSMADRAMTPDQIKSMQAHIIQGMQDGSLASYVGVPLLQDLNTKLQQIQMAPALAQAAVARPPIAAQVVQQAKQDMARGREAPRMVPLPEDVAVPGEMPQEAPSQGEGVASLDSGLPAEYAGGGIVAFADGGEAETPAPDTDKSVYSGFNPLRWIPGLNLFGPAEPTAAEKYRAEIARDYATKALQAAPAAAPAPAPAPAAAPAAVVPAPTVAAPAAPPAGIGAALADRRPPAAPAARPAPSAGIESLAGYKQIQDLAKQLEGQQAPEYSDVEAKKALAGLEGRIGKQKEDNLNQSLMAAGFAMMSGSSPYALQNIGAGAMKGLEAYAKGDKDIKDLQKDIANAQIKLEDARNQNNFKKAELQEKKLTALGTLWAHTFNTAASLEGHKIAAQKGIEAAQIHAGTASAAADRALRAERANMFKTQIAALDADLKNPMVSMDPAQRQKKEAERDAYMKAWAQEAGIGGFPTAGITTTGPRAKPLTAFGG